MDSFTLDKGAPGLFSLNCVLNECQWQEIKPDWSQPQMRVWYLFCTFLATNFRTFSSSPHIHVSFSQLENKLLNIVTWRAFPETPEVCLKSDLHQLSELSLSFIHLFIMASEVSLFRLTADCVFLRRFLNIYIYSLFRCFFLYSSSQPGTQLWRTAHSASLNILYLLK